MTLREVHICLKRIDIRKHNEYAMQAAFYGHKIRLKGVGDPSKVTHKSTSEFTEKDDKAADNAIKKAMLRNKINRQFSKGK